MKILASLAFAAALIWTGAAAAQSTNFSSGVTASDLTALQSSIMAAMPKPASSVPPTDTTTGAVGSSPDYMRADAPRPARYRAGNCTIAGGQGQCTINWSTAFAVTPQPLADPAVLNPGFATSQLTCNWISLSTTQGVIGCRSSILSLAILGNILTALGNGAVVYGAAIQPL